MRCGLFGKLSAKRDFIALSTPRPFLEVWEPWMQSCLSASQHRLGRDWQSAYLTAPLWRFWFGADLCGTTVLGVFMPSVDGVGRCYPLTLMAVADASYSFPPPDQNTFESWFATGEQFLLSTLDRDKPFEQITAVLESLPVPETNDTVTAHCGVTRLDETSAGLVTAGMSFQDALATVRKSNHSTSAAASFWWTEGGGDFPPMALAAHGLLDPFAFSTMLTGRLPAQATASG